jgi:hypothetical protein
MKKITNEVKKEIYGGIGPMMLWVAIMGGVMIAQTVISTITSITDSYHSNGNENKQYSSTSKKSSMYMRVSPFPMRSAVNMWL